MNHLIVLMLVLNLVAGTVVFLTGLASHRRSRRPLLRTLLAYILSFNGLVVVYLGYSYIMINLFGNDPARIVEYPAVFTILLFLVYCAEFGMAVNLFRLVKHLKGETMSGRTKALFGVWVVAFGTASAWSLFLFFQRMQWRTFYWIHAGWIFSVILIILATLLTALVESGGEEGKRNSLRPFAWIFLAGYAAFGFSSLDFYFIHTGVERYYDVVTLLLINLCPLLWLKVFYERKNPPAVSWDFDEGKLVRFCEKHGISKREREIIEQVMAGRSNKDIEQALFISRNTVKNHLYSVFQKAGVKSRNQLVHRVLHFEG